jgi:hypothetical protein
MAARGRRIATPKWATDFAKRVYKVESGNDLYFPIIFRSTAHVPGWRGNGCGGVTNQIPGIGLTLKITIDVGRADKLMLRDEAKFVLLHELAHALTCGEGHNQTFYHAAFKLYKKYLSPELLRYAVEREYMYKPKFATPAARSARLSHLLPVAKR